MIEVSGLVVDISKDVQLKMWSFTQEVNNMHYPAIMYINMCLLIAVASFRSL